MAAAAAGWADGHEKKALHLLALAQQANARHTTYYSSAWIALGREFLQTRNLGTCGSDART